VRWLYETFGIPAPRPGEQVIGNPMLLRVPTEDEAKQVEARRRRIRVATITAEEARQLAAEQDAIAEAEQSAIESRNARATTSRRFLD
jgi:hypothetical protein